MTLRFALLLLACLFTHDAFAGIAVGPPTKPPPTAPTKPPPPPPPTLPTKPPPR